MPRWPTLRTRPARFNFAMGHCKSTDLALIFSAIVTIDAPGLARTTSDNVLHIGAGSPVVAWNPLRLSQCQQIVDGDQILAILGRSTYEATEQSWKTSGGGGKGPGQGSTPPKGVQADRAPHVDQKISDLPLL